MAREILGEGCELKGTQYCDLLNMPGCESCIAFDKEPEELSRMRSDLDVLTSLLPEGGIAHLFLSEDCRFCKGETPGKRACYAMVDMAHREPVRKKRSAIGVKVKSITGSLVPVQIACCAACRKRLRMLEYLPIAIPLLTAVLLLTLVNIGPISDRLRDIAVSLPAILFVGGVTLSCLLGKYAAACLEKEYKAQMHIDPLELPTLREMREKGWFPLQQEKNKGVRPVFLKERLKQGVCTGVPEERVEEQAEEQAEEESPAVIEEKV